VVSSYCVLAIDGGGIRGIIPATVLSEIERRFAPRAVADLFDLIVGTSTGGILALGLTVPDGGRPRHAAEQLLELYVSEARTIFPGGGPQSLTQRVFGTRDRTAWFRDPIELLMRRSSEREETGAPGIRSRGWRTCSGATSAMRTWQMPWPTWS
jgi:hypothetical protein